MIWRGRPGRYWRCVTAATASWPVPRREPCISQADVCGGKRKPHAVALIRATGLPLSRRHPEVLAAKRRASKDGSGRQRVRRSFETPRKRAAPLATTATPLRGDGGGV